MLISHLDELASRESVYLAKHCHMKSPIVYGALVMPMGNFNFAFRSVSRSVYTLDVRTSSSFPRSDYPVPGKPHSFSHHIKFAQVLSVVESLFCNNEQFQWKKEMSPRVFRDMRFSEKERYRAPEKFHYITGGSQMEFS